MRSGARKPPAALVRKGLAEEAKRDFENARLRYEEAVRANPRYVPALVNLSRLLAERFGATENAMKLARQARDLAPGDARAKAALGRIAYLSGNYPWAFGLLRESAKDLPEDPEILLHLGLTAYLVGQVEMATDSVQRALSGVLSPEKAEEARLFLSLTTRPATPDTAAAQVAQAEEQLKARPDHVPALMVKAAWLEQRGRPDEAGSLYRQIMTKVSTFGPAFRNYAWLAAQRGDSRDETMKAAIRARDALPGDPQASGALGILSYLKGDDTQAIRLLRESASQMPVEALVHYYLGMALRRQGDRDGARPILERALQLDPNAPTAEEARQ